MPEYLKENEHPVNQIAKKVLKKPDSSLLYCFQAALEAVENQVVKLLQPDLLENLEALMYLWSPKEAMELLEGEHNLLSDLPQKPNLAQLASAILEQLHRRLSATMEGYPRPNRLPANFR